MPIAQEWAGSVKSWIRIRNWFMDPASLVDSRFYTMCFLFKVKKQMRLLQYLSPETFSEETS